MKGRDVAYWCATVVFCLVLGFSGASHFLHSEFMVENMTSLGYPAYVMTIIGGFKLLGVVALGMPRMPLLKEWAYAGFTFNLVGATLSHIYSGEPPSHWIRPLAVLGFGVASYLLRPASRRLAESPVVANVVPAESRRVETSRPLSDC